MNAQKGAIKMMKKYLLELDRFIQSQKDKEYPIKIVAYLAGGKVFMYYGQLSEKSRDSGLEPYELSPQSLYVWEVTKVFFPKEGTIEKQQHGEVVAVDAESGFLKIRFGSLRTECPTRNQLDLVVSVNEVIWVYASKHLGYRGEF